MIEAGWLIALGATPLFFNIQSERTFEPDKVALLRSIALLMVAAWAIRWIESLADHAGRAARSAAPRRAWSAERVAVLLALLVLIDQGRAAVFSIDPSVSLWGGYHRLQGVYTTGAYLVIFLSIAALLRERAQLERLIGVMVMAGSVVAAYGIAQHHGLDPVVWSGPAHTVARSTMGNQIFASAFLVFTIPLTLYGLARHARRAAAGPGVGAGIVGSVAASIGVWWISLPLGFAMSALLVLAWAVWGRLSRVPGRSARGGFGVGIHGLVLALQLLCVLFAQSRGPFVGLLVGLVVLGLLWAAVERKRIATLMLCGLVGAGVLVLILINLPGSPLGAVADAPVIGRLTQLFSAEGPALVRILIWQGTVDLIGGDPLRALGGWGPETFRVAMLPHYDPALGWLAGRESVPDRAHNATLGTLVETGLVGLAIAIAFVTAVLVVALREIGLFRSARGGLVRLALCLGTGIASAVTVWLADGSWRFLGLALPLGALAGFLVLLGWRGLRPPRGAAGGARPARRSPDPLLVICVTAALIGHLVELQFGIATASTRTFFWAFCALCLVATRMPADESARGGGEPLRAPVWPNPAAPSLVIFVLAFTLGFDFVSASGALFTGSQLGWLFAGACLLIGAIAHAEWARPGLPGSPLQRAATGIGFFGMTCFAGLLLAQLSSPDPSIDAPGWRWGPAIVYLGAMVLCASLGLLLLAGGERRLSRSPHRHPTTLRMRVTIYPLSAALVAGALFVAWRTNAVTIQADIAFKRGKIADTMLAAPDRAVSFYREAVSLSPRQDHYHTGLGAALYQAALRSLFPNERRRLFADAEAAFLEAHRLNPLEADHTANLARLYAAQGAAASPPAPRQALLGKALSWHGETIALSPNRAPLWNEWGRTLTLAGAHEQAVAKHTHARALDPRLRDTYGFLSEGQRRLEDWEKAARTLEEGLRIWPDDLAARTSLADMYLRLGRTDAAIDQYALVAAQDPYARAAHGALITLHRAAGRCAEAAAQARQAAIIFPGDRELHRLAAEIPKTCRPGETPSP